MKHVLGIDYSLTCPALCAMHFDDVDIDVSFQVAVSDQGKKYDTIPGPHPGLPPMVWTHTIQFDSSRPIGRYNKLAQWVIDFCRWKKPDEIWVEDYAFNASGKITALAENMGILKYRLVVEFPQTPIYCVAPTAVKKWATSKGNATKDVMVEKFIEQLPGAAQWNSIWHPKSTKVSSPLTDIADAYWIAHTAIFAFQPKSNRIN